MKRLIVCCDGTWQSQNNDCPTNVLKLAQTIKQTGKTNQGDVIPQILYYDEGIGAIPSNNGKTPFIQTVTDSLRRLGGGAFGWWIDEKIQEAYIFLCLNYQPGDEIYLFGFSRGAYTVRSLAGLISCSGLLKRPDVGKTAEAYDIYRLRNEKEREQKAEEFRQRSADQSDQPGHFKIKLLGCWDTVGALGIPDFTPWLPIDNFLNKQYQFHNTKLSSIIQNARHAIAIDEKRTIFKHTPMLPGKEFQGTIKQVCFPGDHGCVGGGTKETLGLSNAALQWMVDEATKLGLDLDLALAQDTDYINHLVSDRSWWKGKNPREIENLSLDSLHISAKRRWRDITEYRPQNLLALAKELNNWNEFTYQPENLTHRY